MQASRARRFLVSASLANLSLLRIWSELLTYTASDTYLMKLPPAPSQFAAAVAVLLVLTAVFFLLTTWAEKTSLGKLVFFVFLAIPLNALREVVSQQFPLLRGPLLRVLEGRTVFIGIAVLAAAGLIAAVRFRRRAYSAVTAVAIIAAPFLAITLGRGLWTAGRYDDSRFRDKPPAPRMNGKAGAPRVLWIVFDEMDQEIAFEQTKIRLNLPEFERFRKTAVYATQVYPPSSATSTSIPALLSGKMVTKAEAAGPDELRIAYAGAPNEWLSWTREPGVLSLARQMGLNTAVIGWYHPYCRVINADATYCHWEAMPYQADAVSRSFPQAAIDYARSLFETSLLSPFGQSLVVEAAASRYQALDQVATKIAADPAYGLVFLHTQAPHGPHAYSRRTGQFGLTNAPIHGYADSLELADCTLRDIRAAMEANNVWDSTTILLTSDHWYRSAGALTGKPSDHRVPFMLKLAGDNAKGAVHSSRFESVHSAGLVLGILRGELRTTEEVIQWLDSRGPS